MNDASSFPTGRMVGGERGHPFKNADFKHIFARSASSVAPGEKVQLSLIESPLRLTMSQYEQHTLTLTLSPPKEALKRKAHIFHVKVDLSKIDAFSFPVPTMFGAEHRLPLIF